MPTLNTADLPVSENSSAEGKEAGNGASHHRVGKAGKTGNAMFGADLEEMIRGLQGVL